MLEGAGFDFRNRQPQKLVIKLSKRSGFAKDRVGKTAYNMSLDLYRTFAPLKQTTAAMAIACVELAARLCDANMDLVVGDRGIDYARWKVTRAEAMGSSSQPPHPSFPTTNVPVPCAETMLDLLDLYTHHRGASLIGPNYPLDTYINIRIALNQESKDAHLPRYTNASPPPAPSTKSNPPPAPTKPANGLPPKPGTTTTNGASASAALPARPPPPQQEPSPATPVIALPVSAVGTRGLGGTVRFMLDAARARDEKDTVAGYFKDEEEEYEIEVEVAEQRGNNDGGRGLPPHQPPPSVVRRGR